MIARGTFWRKPHSEYEIRTQFMFFKKMWLEALCYTLAQLLFSLSTVPLIKPYRKMLLSTLSAAWSGVQGAGRPFSAYVIFAQLAQEAGGGKGGGVRDTSTWSFKLNFPCLKSISPPAPLNLLSLRIFFFSTSWY